jgi:hypothetical protein
MEFEKCNKPEKTSFILIEVYRKSITEMTIGHPNLTSFISFKEQNPFLSSAFQDSSCRRKKLFFLIPIILFLLVMSAGEGPSIPAILLSFVSSSSDSDKSPLFHRSKSIFSQEIFCCSYKSRGHLCC